MSPTSYQTALSRDFVVTYSPYKLAEEKGFEPLRRLHDLPVFKTGPFNQTWVFLQMVPKVGLEPTRVLKLAGF